MEQTKYLKITTLYENDNDTVFLNVTNLAEEEFNAILALDDDSVDNSDVGEFLTNIGNNFPMEGETPKYKNLVVGNVFSELDPYERQEDETKEAYQIRHDKYKTDSKVAKAEAKELNKKLNQTGGCPSIIIYGWC